MSVEVFVPQAILDVAFDGGKIDLDADQLIVDGALRFDASEAIRILREVTSGEDPHGLCERVRTTDSLAAIDAELLGHSLLVGESAYDVVPGMLLQRSAKGTADDGGPSDETILAAMRSLQHSATYPPPYESEP
jgi:hypothetical protein